MSILKLVKFNLKIEKKKIFLWCISSFIIIFIYMILFPYVQDVAKVEMEMMPEELLKLFGIDSYKDLGNYNNYFESIYNIFIVAISIYAVIYTVNLIEKEEKNKTLEFMYSLSITRNNIIISKILVAIIAITSIIFFSFLSVAICGSINGGDSYNVMEIFKICLNSLLITYVYIAVGIFLGGCYISRADSEIGAGITVVMYLSGVISTMLSEKYEFIKYLSPFEVIKYNDLPTLLTYLVICSILISIGVIRYNKRDFKI